MTPTYAAVLQREEYISPKEYLERRENGQIDPKQVRYASHDPKTGEPGGFWVKLNTPIYALELLPVSGKL